MFLLPAMKLLRQRSLPDETLQYDAPPRWSAPFRSSSKLTYLTFVTARLQSLARDRRRTSTEQAIQNSEDRHRSSAVRVLDHPAAMRRLTMLQVSSARVSSCLVKDCARPRSRGLTRVATTSSAIRAEHRENRACPRRGPPDESKPDENVYSRRSARRMHRDGPSKAGSRPTLRPRACLITSRARHRLPGLPSSNGPPVCCAPL